MAKFEINAGAKIEVATPAEVHDALSEVMRGWRVELARGLKFRPFVMLATNNAGTWTTGAQTGDVPSHPPAGPDTGYVWAVQRVAIGGGAIVKGTDVWSLYVGDASDTKLVQSGIGRGSIFGQCAVILNPGETLAAAGAATGVAGQDIVISGFAIECPVQTAWQLL